MARENYPPPLVKKGDRMKKYNVLQCYQCEKRRRLIFMVEDTITGENYHFSEDEWKLRKDEKQDAEIVEEHRRKTETKVWQKRRKK
jgi:hypothetical protein